MRGLPTLESLLAFLKKNTAYEKPSDPVDFFRTYRASPEQFQQNGWKGPCNNFAEFTCHWGYVHDMPMYLLSIRPRSAKDLATLEPWHQVSAFKCNGRIYVIDNNEIHDFGSLSEYETRTNSQIVEVGGLLKWHKTQDNPLARFYWQKSLSISEEDMEEVKQMPSARAPVRKPVT